MITSKQINEQEVTARDGARIRYERTGRRTDADLCSLRRREQENRLEVLQVALGAFLKTARASSKPAQVRDGAENRERTRTEREAPKSVRQHFVLSTRDAFFFVVLFLL